MTATTTPIWLGERPRSDRNSAKNGKNDGLHVYDVVRGTTVDVPVEAYDERLTTRMAESSRRSGAQAPEDALAAAHLLEGYLASRRGTGA